MTENMDCSTFMRYDEDQAICAKGVLLSTMGLFEKRFPVREGVIFFHDVCAFPGIPHRDSQRQGRNCRRPSEGLWARFENSNGARGIFIFFYSLPLKWKKAVLRERGANYDMLVCC